MRKKANRVDLSGLGMTISHKVYANWGGPLETPGLSGCSEFLENGQWIASSRCDAQLPFICKIENSYDPNINEDLGEASCDPSWLLIPSDKAKVLITTLLFFRFI